MRIKAGYFFMDKIKYVKQPLSINQKIKFLRTQGLTIDNQDTAYHALSVVGYYRLSGYLLPFKLPHNNDQTPRKFKSGSSFDQIWQLYQFDRELRLLVIDTIEKIEVAFRTAIADTTSMRLDPFWYIDKNHYKDAKHYSLLMNQIQKVISDKYELFIKHYLRKYTNPDYPPIWMIIETLSFGTCSKLFANIKRIEHKKAICESLGYPPIIIESWMHALTYTRNLCAHHARLWNRWLVYIPLIPKNDSARKYFYTTKNYKFHLVAYVLYKLLQQIAPKSPWREKLYKLFEKYECFPGPAMGFTNNWREDPFWEL